MTETRTTINVDKKNVDESALVGFIESLEEITGCHVDIGEYYVLKVDDPKTAAIIRTVFDGNGMKPVQDKRHEPAKVAKKGGKSGRVVKNKWQVLKGPAHVGEVMTTQQINRMIKIGELAEGTLLLSMKRGPMLVEHGCVVPAEEAPEGLAMPQPSEFIPLR